ncbi:hypothetical protein P872_01955 [Rhodonellum psychrophilum GCM71 = DSM 17998]|uniref:Uncharacterized protein n=1 Tax=Rhodonellum psychrophilum GCM71 = DSM 17998 TaxID=1123057 RepID=U5C158_9BACT|nr:hypothetical protein P872_01955 [Rhodonellum psychrophilum GCM71 = DSM 17998]
MVYFFFDSCKNMDNFHFSLISQTKKGQDEFILPFLFYGIELFWFQDHFDSF